MRRSPLKRKPYRLKRKTKLRRKGKSILSRLDAKLWELFSIYIRKRDKWICFTCGKTNTDHRNIHAGHLISRRFKAVKFDPKNVHAQCAGCNLYLKGNVAEYAKRFIDKYGVDEYHALVLRGRKTKQWSEKELQSLIDALKNGEDYVAAYNKIKI